MNGKHCIHGLATRKYDDNGFIVAECIDVKKVEQDGPSGSVTINAPYQCNPSDNEKPCKFIFDPAAGDNGKYEVPCKCALDGSQDGYCSEIIGTEIFKTRI